MTSTNGLLSCKLWYVKWIMWAPLPSFLTASARLFAENSEWGRNRFWEEVGMTLDCIRRKLHHNSNYVSRRVLFSYGKATGIDSSKQTKIESSRSSMPVCLRRSRQLISRRAWIGIVLGRVGNWWTESDLTHWAHIQNRLRIEGYVCKREECIMTAD